MTGAGAMTIRFARAGQILLALLLGPAVSGCTMHIHIAGKYYAADHPEFPDQPAATITVEPGASEPLTIDGILEDLNQ